MEVLVTELGYRVNPFDHCVLTLDNDSDAGERQKNDKTRGVIVIEVDDLLEAADEYHREKMDWLEKRLKFGKVVNLMNNPGGTGYAGRRVRQNSDGSVRGPNHPNFASLWDRHRQYTMDYYVKNRLKYVNIDRKVLKRDYNTTILNSDEETQLRGALAAVNWASRE